MRIDTVTVDAGNGFETDLRLTHTRGRNSSGVPDQGLANEYLVFGAWETRTDTGDLADPVEPPKADAVWSGSIPRTDPEAWGTGSARYEGKVVGHFKRGEAAIKDRDPWHEFVADVDLRANFASGQRNISGAIDTFMEDDGTTPRTLLTGTQGTRAGLSKITLEQTKIGASMSGKATTDGTDSKGTWNAGFFGTAVGGEPGGIAGDFASDRPLSTSQSAIQIQGAFGGHNVDDLQ